MPNHDQADGRVNSFSFNVFTVEILPIREWNKDLCSVFRLISQTHIAKQPTGQFSNDHLLSLWNTASDTISWTAPRALPLILPVSRITLFRLWDDHPHNGHGLSWLH